MEINLEVKEDQVDRFTKMVEREMIEAFNHYAPDVPCSVSINVDNFWVH